MVAQFYVGRIHWRSGGICFVKCSECPANRCGDMHIETAHATFEMLGWKFIRDEHGNCTATLCPDCAEKRVSREADA